MLRWCSIAIGRVAIASRSPLSKPAFPRRMGMWSDMMARIQGMDGRKLAGEDVTGNKYWCGSLLCHSMHGRELDPIRACLMCKNTQSPSCFALWLQMCVDVTSFWFCRLIPPEKGSDETAWRREIEYKGGSDMVYFHRHRKTHRPHRFYCRACKVPLLGHLVCVPYLPCPIFLR